MAYVKVHLNFVRTSERDVDRRGTGVSLNCGSFRLAKCCYFREYWFGWRWFRRRFKSRKRTRDKDETCVDLLPPLCLLAEARPCGLKERREGERGLLQAAAGAGSCGAAGEIRQRQLVEKIEQRRSGASERLRFWSPSKKERFRQRAATHRKSIFDSERQLIDIRHLREGASAAT
ncbi:hypothetical protein Bbelb_107690 [Branchiostoma belcheri]|nr:hypothetical protein Bbelb_107690 [Branchiostoma belcheri]